MTTNKQPAAWWANAAGAGPGGSTPRNAAGGVGANAAPPHGALAAAAAAPGQPVPLDLPEEAATVALGRALGERLGAGDAVMLAGPLGAGKSVLARAAVRAYLDTPEAEVPSPSYTIVNVYEPAAAPALWHADLYRLGDASELAELGLEEAFEDAVAIVEWPDRLDVLPQRRLEIALAADEAGEAPDRRCATIRALGPWPRLVGAAP
ncbi:MAG: tRNA (adenosine(37)-N6)-threonylcarbamoyltransferase complex ATPase subunit type 1 TsaE [Pseudomonadota bacterium]